MLADFPPHVQREVQRILDGAARRLLAEELDRDPTGPTSRTVTMDDWDDFSLAERRALIKATVESATVAPVAKRDLPHEDAA